MSGSVALDLKAGTQTPQPDVTFYGTLTGNVTLSASNLSAGCAFVVQTTQGSGGPYTLNYPKYAGGTPGGIRPAVTAVAGAVDAVAFYSLDGSVLYAVPFGINMSNGA
jgi:hypothetical protein